VTEWRPTDLEAVSRRLQSEIIKQAVQGRVTRRPDPYEPGSATWGYDEADDTEYDGANVGEEVVGMIYAGLLEQLGDHVEPTTAGLRWMQDEDREHENNHHYPYRSPERSWLGREGRTR
jgi:hypothetical protein